MKKLFLIFFSLLILSIKSNPQNIIGVGINRDMEMSFGHIHDNHFYLSTDIAFPVDHKQSVYFNIGIGHLKNRSVTSVKVGLYSPNGYSPPRLQIGGEYLLKVKSVFIGGSYLNESKLTIKILVKI